MKPDRSLYPTERNELPTIQRLNNRYSLFAHVIEGNDVLELLRPGDVLVRYCSFVRSLFFLLIVMFVCLSVCLPCRWTDCSFVRSLFFLLIVMFVCLSVCLADGLTVRLFVVSSSYWSSCLFVCLSVCLADGLTVSRRWLAFFMVLWLFLLNESNYRRTDWLHSPSVSTVLKYKKMKMKVYGSCCVHKTGATSSTEIAERRAAGGHDHRIGIITRDYSTFLAAWLCVRYSSSYSSSVARMSSFYMKTHSS